MNCTKWHQDIGGVRSKSQLELVLPNRRFLVRPLGCQTNWFFQLENRCQNKKEFCFFSTIATEIGLDTYKKVEDARCLDGQKHWAQNKKAWNAIQEMWMHMRDHHPNFSLTSKVSGKLLWEALFELEETAMQQASTQAGGLNVEDLQQNAHDLIHQYMVVLP